MVLVNHNEVTFGFIIFDILITICTIFNLSYFWYIEVEQKLQHNAYENGGGEQVDVSPDQDNQGKDPHIIYR